MASTHETPIVLLSSSPPPLLHHAYDAERRSFSRSSADASLPSLATLSAMTPHPRPNVPLTIPVDAQARNSLEGAEVEMRSAFFTTGHAESTTVDAPAVQHTKARKRRKIEADTVNVAPAKAGEQETALDGHNDGSTRVDVPSKGVKRKRVAKTSGSTTTATKSRKRASKAEQSAAAVEEGATSTQTEAITTPELAPKARAKPRKKADTKGKAPAIETSHHFDALKSGAQSGQESDRKRSDDGAAHEDQELGLETALQRKRSWTPAAADELPPSNQQDGEGAQADAAGFHHIVNAFGYQDDHSKPAAKKTTNAGATRKRKVDGKDAMVPKKRAAPAKKPAAPKKPKKPKPPKVPKQPRVFRPKTVTDFAIAGYRKDRENAAGQAVKPVATFFQPTSTQIVHLENDPSSILEPEVRKPGKRSRTMAAEFLFPSPEKAQLRMQDQDFLFGTSSQLQKDDSPITHRMMQEAIIESEETAFASQARSMDLERSPTTSRVRVAHAPHGTSLSVDPGERGLWSAATRDQELKVFPGSQKPRHSPVIAEQTQGPSEPSSRWYDIDETLGRTTPPFNEANEVPHEPQVTTVQDYDEDKMVAWEASSPADGLHDSGFVDISDADKSHASQEKAVPNQEGALEVGNAASAGPYRPRSPVVQTVPEDLSRPVLQVIDINTSPMRPPPVNSLKFSPTAVLASPKRKSAQQPEGPPAEPSEAPAKRPRGRPRKNAQETTKASAASTTPKKRPSKKAPLPKSPSPNPQTPKRARKSPKLLTQPSSTAWHDIDEISDSEPGLSTPSPPRMRNIASSPPATPRTLELSSSPDIPLAKSAGKSRTSVKASTVASDVIATAAAATAAPQPIGRATDRDEAAAVQSTDPNAMYTALFKTISRTVKAAPRGTVARPSWWEKMLLYDPIVLEDLTTWLVGQGVRPDGSVEKGLAGVGDDAVAEVGGGVLEMHGGGSGGGVERPKGDGEGEGGIKSGAEEKEVQRRGKGKGKGKGRDKGKGKAQDEIKDKNALQPWVVQKWCEANSVCCLWKAGLRGGVRARY